MSGRIMAFAEKTGRPLLAIILLGVIIRLILAPTLTFNIDIAYWAEVIDVFQNGFGLYGTAGYYYTPIWGYCLGFIAFVMQIFGITDFGAFAPELYHLVNNDLKISGISAFVTSVEFNTILKLFLIAVDVAVAVVIYRFVMKHTDGDEKKSCFAALLWMLSPMVISQSSVHGMFDSISALMILLTVMFAMDRRYFIAGALFSLAVFTKFFPLFFTFLLIAFVLKKEGVNVNGARNLLKAVVGFIAATVIIYIPNIVNGDFWDSFYFFAYRIGVDRQTLASITPMQTVEIIALILIIVAVIIVLIAKYGERIMAYAHSINPKVRDRNVMKVLSVIALILIVATLTIVLLSPNLSLTSLGFGGVAAISIFSIFLEIYFAYRLLMSDKGDDTQKMTFLFLTATTILLWPCLPSYVLVTVPFIICYAVTVDRSFVKPYLIMSVAMTLSEITSYILSPTSLVMALTGNISAMVPVYEFMTSPVFFGMAMITILSDFFGAIAYLSLICIPFKWFREYRRRESS